MYPQPERKRSSLLLVGLLALAVVLPRSLLITQAHSECVDDEYHLDHGLAHLTGVPHPLTYNDPPLGEVVLVLPLYLMGARVAVTVAPDSNGRPMTLRNLYHGQRHSPETLRMVMAAWKSLLFVPCVVVAFAWARRLYGVHCAWLAAALLLVEPTIAAHIPVAALDVLAMEMVIISSYCIWRYVVEPTRLRLFVAGVAMAAALLIKHTAVLIPAAVVVLAVLHWVVRPGWRERSRAALVAPLRPTFNRLAAGAMIVLAALWPLTLFDVSRPIDAGRVFGVEYEEGFGLDDVLLPAVASRWPAGIYFGSVFEALQHGRDGHSGLLWGEVRENGWWYYFFAVALYKVPIGIALLMLLAALSIAWVRPRWDELFIVVPLVACVALLCASGINIGFRHALPAYGLLLLLASRCVADGGGGALRFRMVVAWSCVALAAVHVASYHPDYLSYLNAPWRRPWLAIGDSNLDWGQNLKQLNAWLDANPQPPGKVIHYDGFDEPSDPAFAYYIKHEVRPVPADGTAQPTSGLLIVCPTHVAGAYQRAGRYRYLHDVDPVAVIGHSLLVYDLDALNAKKR